jgi:hypothetical protein
MLVAYVSKVEATKVEASMLIVPVLSLGVAWLDEGA